MPPLAIGKGLLLRYEAQYLKKERGDNLKGVYYMAITPSGRGDYNARYVFVNMKEYNEHELHDDNKTIEFFSEHFKTILF